MAWTYENITSPIIENTVMLKDYENGIYRTYSIAPADGYVLHDSNYDEEVIDPDTLMPTGEIKLGYRTTTASCGYNYTFTPVQVIAVNGQTVTAYGSREFYAIPASEVPTDQKLGADNY